MSKTKCTRSHGDVINEMCLTCMSVGQRPISEEAKNIIREHVFSRYKEVADNLPQRLCGTCYRKLTRTQQGQQFVALLDYDKMAQDLAGRDNSVLATLCSCGACQHATWKPPHPRAKHPDSAYHKAREATATPSTSAAAASSSAEASGGSICSNCFSEKGKGKDHTCNKGNRLQNMDRLISPRSKDQFASMVIRQRAEASETGTFSLQNVHGKPTQVTKMSAKRQLFPQQPVPNTAFQALQVSENLSGRALARTAQTFRAEGVPVEPHLRETLHDQSRRLESYFELKSLEFSQKSDQGVTQKLTKAVVVCSYPDGLIGAVKRERGIQFCRNHLGMDGGGGFLKLCLNVIEQPRTPTQSPVKKKANVTGGDRFKDSGVKKLFIVGIVPGVQENYHNVKVLLEATKVSSLTFSLATDMKLANILCGIMSHGSKHPCCWCEISNEYIVTQSAIPRKRTLGTIREQARKYQSAIKEGKKVRPQDFVNCVEEPLFKDLPDDTSILSLIPPPELHLMLGVTAKLYEEVLKRLETDGGDKQRIEKWAKEHNIVREEYRGGTMEGNKCRTLLKKAVDLGKELPDKYRVFAVALHRFSKVVTSCFGKDLVLVDNKAYEQLILEFHEVYLACRISMTPKVHAVIMHVPEWCYREGKGLGHASEQASESVHHDFKAKWQHFKVREDNPRFGDSLLRCVVAYNSLHI